MKIGPILCALLAVASVRADALRYKVLDLGTLGGTYASPTALNASGHATGTSTTSDGAVRAFIYRNGNMIDLGTLGGGSSTGSAINDADEVVGTSSDSNGNRFVFLWSNGSMTSKGTLGGSESFGGGINNNGFVTGSAYTTNDAALRAFLFTPGVGMAGIPTLGGTNGFGIAINASNQVAGFAEFLGDVVEHAYRYTPGGGVTDLGTLGGEDSVARDINNAGHVVGYSANASGDTHAFLAISDSMVDLGTFPSGSFSTARAINNHGVIVGHGSSAISSPRAFVRLDEKLRDLNEIITPQPGLVLESAVDINDSGQILCEGRYNNNDTRALLLTPETVLTPKVRISGPKKIVTDKSSLIVKGTTSGEVDLITCLGKKGAAKPAKGTSRWFFKAILKPGANVFLVTATGYGGTSAPAKITIVRK
jgi:probable HAF family extracellular repeat protein